MFELDRAIAEWRRQMAGEGIKSPALLDELESHLQDDVERQVQSGTSAKEAFHAAVNRLGQPRALTNEFSKVGETNEASARLKYFFRTLAGIQNPSLATNMNTSISNPEPAWATYLKSGAFALPAAVLWVFVAVFAFPKFKQVVHDSGLTIPAAFQFGMGLMAFLRNYLLVIGGGVILAVTLLEWRSKAWPKYRRAAFGTGAFLLNLAVLIIITTMFILALVAGPIVSHHVK
jgi:hypothetical protein